MRLAGCIAAAGIAISLTFAVKQILIYRDTKGQAVYGGDSFGTRNFQTREITPSNVSSLKMAWSVSTGETSPANVALESSPIFYQEKLILVTATGRLIALNGETGKRIWSFTPRGYNHLEGATKRGASLWTGKIDGVWKSRVFYCYHDQLVAIDPETGKVVMEFDGDGDVSLLLPGQEKYASLITYNSPPLIAGDMVVCGSAIPDNVSIDTPQGVVSAFSCVTGKRLWSWLPIPAEKGGKKVIGGANVWSIMSYDPGLKAIYANTGSAATDSFGGERPGNNENANSLVCLSAENGEVRWAQQLIHHDVWDYDLPAQPLLFDYENDVTRTPAVATVTKAGDMFLFDRKNGQPLNPIHEVPVPQNGAKGELLSKTQPRPVSPLPFTPQGITLADAWGTDKAGRRLAQKAFKRYGNASLFTPPNTKGIIQRPGTFGGMNWSGMAYDPSNKFIITTTNNFPVFVKLLPDSKEKFVALPAWHDASGPMMGTPYMALVESLFYTGTPFVKPPWGEIMAVDSVKGTIAWKKPLGYLPKLDHVKGYREFGSPSLGGAFTTTTGLTFIAGTLDHHLRALETATGKELAALPLPYGGQALPTIYSIRGKEYVVIACGGHFAIDRDFGNQIVAFTL